MIELSDRVEVDPNEDLIGLTLADFTVTGSACWNPAYVNVTYDDGTLSVRRAEQLRIARRLGA